MLYIVIASRHRLCLKCAKYILYVIVVIARSQYLVSLTLLLRLSCRKRTQFKSIIFKNLYSKSSSNDNIKVSAAIPAFYKLQAYHLGPNRVPRSPPASPLKLQMRGGAISKKEVLHMLTIYVIELAGYI